MSLASCRGWGPLILLPATVVWIVPSDCPRWLFMWLLALAIFCGCKWLTWRRTSVHAGWPTHLGYLMAWPGMDAGAFLDKRSVAGPALSEWILAGGKLAIGLWLLFAATRLVPAGRWYLLGWVGMIGLILVLHFGILHLLSCAWRGAGVDARPLMQRPLASVGVSQFWGRRWNTAFRDLTYRFLFRPLSRWWGPRTGLAAGFVASGLVHDLVISLPAGAGFGGPTLFFVVQGLATLIERSPRGRRLGLGRGVRGRLFAAAVLLLPACLLFHPPFVEAVVLPFLRFLGAI